MFKHVVKLLKFSKLLEGSPHSAARTVSHVSSKFRPLGGWCGQTFENLAQLWNSHPAAFLLAYSFGRSLA